jgi:uncharacterized protein YbjT (DUF2867 family)
MKIIITGSLGNISRPLTQMLVKKNHTVTVISSKQERRKEIEELGALAAIGTMEDVNFLTKTFTGADIVYCMETLSNELLFDKNLDYVTAMTNIGNNYKQAIQQSGVKKVIHLSSTGAHTNKGVGLLALHYNVENILKQLPADVIIKTMRPGGFYYNVLAFIPTIKAVGAIVQNYGGDKKQPWVSPVDIASVIAEEMELPFNERKIRYIASDELSPNEMAQILGEAIGKPDLNWLSISDEQMLNNMITAGMNQALAKGMTEMNAARINGVLYEDYFRNRPALSNTKFKAYAKEFAAVYNNSNQ